MTQATNKSGLVVPKGLSVGYKPDNGSQVRFLRFKYPPVYPDGKPITNKATFIVLNRGSKGSGKSNGLVADFMQDVGKGYGKWWKGLIVRKTKGQLKELIDIVREIALNCFPGTEEKEGGLLWIFPDGETLRLIGIERPEDYGRIHGIGFTWFGWDELTLFADEELFDRVNANLRSGAPEIIREATPKKPAVLKSELEALMRIRATTNSDGIGAHWVRRRFKSPECDNRMQVTRRKKRNKKTGKIETAITTQICITSETHENTHLSEGYDDTILDMTKNNPGLRKSWRDNEWDMLSGAYFGDIWEQSIHVIPKFDPCLLDNNCTRSHDWGSSTPSYTGWFLRVPENKTVKVKGKEYYFVKGDVILFHELYTQHPDVYNKGLMLDAWQVAKLIKMEDEKLEADGVSVYPGPADPSIYNNTASGKSVAQMMEEEDVWWEDSEDRIKDRAIGWEYMRGMLNNCKPERDDLPREKPGFFVMSNCIEFIRTFPSMPRDAKKPHDVDTNCEDHPGDATRYNLTAYRISHPITKRKIPIHV